MSLPPELRVLCAHLTSVSTTDLPRLTPALLRLVSQCRVPLSSPAANSAKLDSNTASVQVHKLKVQLTSLLNGKSPEGRFTAVVLIKSVVEVGGLEMLKTSEPWVRGLLSILGVNILSQAQTTNQAKYSLETGPNGDERNVYCDFDKDLLHDPAVPNTSKRNYHTYLARIHNRLPKYHIFENHVSRFFDHRYHFPVFHKVDSPS